MSWSDLTRYLASSGEPRLVLSFVQLEQIIGRDLPASARRHPPFWANSESRSYAKHWLSAGYRTTTAGIPSGQIGFVRTVSPPSASVPSPAPAADVVPPPAPDGEVVALVGCVKTKLDHVAAAKDLYVSDQFRKRRTYVEERGYRWYVLSARHGLVGPEELLEPYDVALADQTASYRAAWGGWVAARLEAELGDLDGRKFVVLAGAAYADAVADPLTHRGADVERPLEGLRQGEQLAWFNAAAADAPAALARTGLDDVSELVRVLGDPMKARPVPEFFASRTPTLNRPGMYSWWVDDVGAAQLAAGLGHTVEPGLIYAGQAGATRSQSGQRSTNTLWGRLAKMHLGARASFSTFRLTLAAILQAPRDGVVDEVELTAWMTRHLAVATYPMSDGDRIDVLETAVLATLDPPLNLAKRPPTPLRITLSRLRKESGVR